MSAPPMVPLLDYHAPPPAEVCQRAAEFLAEMRRRRSVRTFSDRRVPREAIRDCVAAAATAPSGANLQPWHFVVVESPAVKQQLRAAAEREERAFYGSRAPRQWLDDLAPLGTGPDKPFLETAPYLIVVFVEMTSRTPEGTLRRNYYASTSAGIAVGILITALHHAGLVCLPYTPSRMGFLNSLLARPENERPMLILVTGYPAEDARVPVLERKPLTEVLSFA
jgi:nitroreductase